VVEALLQDVRYAVRWLRRTPAFTLTAVVSLSVGIGFNTALFSVVDAVLFRPLPVERPETLVEVYTSGGDGGRHSTTSYPDLLDVRARTDVFTEVIGYSPMLVALNLQERSRLVLGEVVSGNYFQALGIRPAAGRTLLPDDDRPGAERVAVLSHDVWRRDHAADPAVVGRPLRLRGQVYTIVGVAQAGFTGMVPVLAPELWVPVAHVEDVEPAGIQEVVPSPSGTTPLDRRGQRWLFVKARLKPGVTAGTADANLGVLSEQLRAEHPQTNRERTLTAVPSAGVRIHPSGDGLMLTLGIALMVAVGLVLVVACANLASMLLARAASRRREIGIRLAIGAGRGRLVGQLLTESLVLALAGAAGGLLLAGWLTRAAASVQLPIPIPVALDLRIDWRVLVFTLGVSLAAGVLAGLAPALKASSRTLADALRPESGASVAGRRWTLRDGLVAFQMAVTVVLLVASGLLIRSLTAAQATDPGFQVEGLAVVSTDSGMLNYDEERGRQFWEQAVERARGLPGVESVALASRLPFSLNFNQATFHLPGVNAPGDRGTIISTSSVSADYFTTIGVPILQGQGFTWGRGPDATREAIVSEATARRYWPGESPLGRRMRLRTADGPVVEIVGVSADYRVQTVGEPPTPYVHLALPERPSGYHVLVARTRGSAAATLAAMRRELLALNDDVVFLDNQTMEQQVAATLLPVRAGAWIVSVVGAVAMLLAAIGLYGVIAYSVARRTREIGVRMALGANRADVIALVMRQGLTVAVVGLAAGSVLALLAARAVSGLLYGVGSTDWAAWTGATAMLLAVAAAANLLPARRAARVQPSVALRGE
jgi:predicted permease